MKGDLFVCYPQWQGSGPSKALWEAAQHLRQHFPAIPFRDIPVAVEPLTQSRNGIAGSETILKQQQSEYRLVTAEDPQRVFSLGGDCSIEIVPVSWLNGRYDGRLAVIWLDAHGDLNSPETSSSQHFHGMPLRFLLGSGGPFADSFCRSRLEPTQLVMAGVRELDPPEARFIQEAGIQVFTVGDIEADPRLIGRQVLQHGRRCVYLHIDLDVLEPTEFPYLKCPAPGGMRIETLLEVIHSLKTDCEVVGFSVLEFTRIQGSQGLADIRRIVEAGIGDWLP
jgi:arginase